jgi:alpha-tubulin suppressor-like RCC1 family protein
VRGLRRVTALAAGDAHTCALDESGAVRCWGDDRSGQVGAQGASNPAVPAPVALPF